MSLILASFIMSDFLIHQIVWWLKDQQSFLYALSSGLRIGVLYVSLNKDPGAWPGSEGEMEEEMSS